MAPGGFVDMENSTKISTTVLRTSIPDDIFEEALAASKYDSDGEDPYGPQPKRFMQTEQQKERQKRALEIRKVAWTIRKMRKTYKRTSPFSKLPSELVLKLMQHTRLRDLDKLIQSSPIIRGLFRANAKAVFRGIEIEQFSEWKWLFGDSKHRTPAQSQHLKDAILSENYTLDSGALGWTHDKQLLDILRMVDDNEFTGVRNVMFLQKLQTLVDLDMEVLESHTKMKIARRTAICLRSLSFQRPGVVNEEDRTEDKPIVTVNGTPWEARSQLFNEQPASIQAETRSILKIVIEELYQRIERMLLSWVGRHYDNPDNRGAPQELKKWVSKLVTGLILELVIPRWYSEIRAGSPTVHFDWWFGDSIAVLARELADSLDQYDMGNVDVVDKDREGVEFGKSIGLDVERLLEGTMAGDFMTFSVQTTII